MVEYRSCRNCGTLAYMLIVALTVCAVIAWLL